MLPTDMYGPDGPTILQRVWRNPVLIAFFAIAIIDVVVSDGVTWRAPVLAVLGVVVRFLTSPAFEAYDREDQAYRYGYSTGVRHR